MLYRASKLDGFFGTSYETENGCKITIFCLENLKGRVNSKDVGVDGKII
jgi:hypothetical protein